MSLDRNPDPDPDDRKYARRREKEELAEQAALKRETEEVRQEFDLQAYELAESDDMERLAARRRFLEETERQREWLARKKEKGE